MKSKTGLVFLIFVLFLTSGCATSRIRSPDRRGMFDRPSRSAQYDSKDDARSARPLFQKQESIPEYRKVSLRQTIQKWRWPLENPIVTSHFGVRGNDPHEGVDLKAQIGTPVYAASSGQVLYSGQRITGYGKIVIIRHANRLSSIYAHNTSVLVKAGQYVRAGQKIALSGNTGRTTGPHVHFEIRDGTTPVNPVEFMPGSTNPPKKINRQIARVSSRKRKTGLN